MFRFARRWRGFADGFLGRSWYSTRTPGKITISPKACCRSLGRLDPLVAKGRISAISFPSVPESLIWQHDG
jgi:hypothetical protein